MRFVITMLRVKEIRLLSAVGVVIADFIAGSLIFLTVFSLAQGVVAFVYTWWVGKLPTMFKHATSDISMAVLAVATMVVTLLIVEAVALIPYGNLYTIVPYADLFWASMWPSAWLWSYIGLSVVARRVISLFPVASWAVNTFDFEDHAFRELGFVGAIVIAAAGYVVLEPSS
jgi:hypothetical protein